MENKANGILVAKIALVFIMLVVAFLGGFGLGKIDLYSTPSTSNIYDNKTANTNSNPSSYKGQDLTLLWEVWDKLDENYIESDLDNQKLLYGAVKGLVAGLDDQYTAFLDPEDTKNFLDASQGKFEGIGTTLTQQAEFVAIESPIDDAPAQKAGLKAGDIVLSIDGEDTQGQSVHEVASKIRGEAGTKVTLKLFRPSTDKQFEVTIIRAQIDIDNIVLKSSDNGIAEIKIYKFTEDSVEAFNDQWDNVVDQVLKSNPKGIIVDLRNNPGGYVSAVEYVLNDFLPKGKIIFIEESRQGKQEKFKVIRNGRLTDIPMVVLVNDGSASASEIFAGAIQDHNRGKIIGLKTVGKGVEQRLLNMSDGSILQVVFQRWLTPNGKNISHDDPIIPDIIEEDTDKQMQIAKQQLN